MGAGILVGVGPHRPDLDENPGQLDGILLNPLHDLATDIVGHGDRPISREAPTLLPIFLQQGDIGVQVLRQRLQQALTVLHVLAHDGDAECRAVVDEQMPVTVVNRAAGRGNRQNTGAILFRLQLVAFAADHLQVPETENQQQEDRRRSQREKKESVFQVGRPRPAGTKTHDRDPDAATPAPASAVRASFAAGRARRESA